jgi:hypothetical protein
MGISAGFDKFLGCFFLVLSSVIFFVAKFCYFAKNIFNKEYSDTNSLFLKRKLPNVLFQNASKFVTIAYNMKGYLKSFYFHILNIAKIG